MMGKLLLWYRGGLPIMGKPTLFMRDAGGPSHWAVVRNKT